MPKKWSKPKDVSPAQAAFPAKVLGTYLPEIHEVPDYPQREQWEDVVHRWFSKGLDDIGMVSEDDLDREKALQHLSTCMKSYEPKHEHKISGVAWLMSMWYTDVLERLDDNALKSLIDSKRKWVINGSEIELVEEEEEKET